MRMNMKNRSHRHNLNRTRPRHGYEYTKKCVAYKKACILPHIVCALQHSLIHFNAMLQNNSKVRNLRVLLKCTKIHISPRKDQAKNKHLPWRRCIIVISTAQFH